jgi:uncharacterized membrane protein
MDNAIANLLRAGVILSAAFVLLGGVLYLRRPAAAPPDYRQFTGVAAPLRTLSGIVSGASHLDPRSLIQFGILLLIATPIARVVMCVIAFARQRDLFYAAISAAVLAILLFSILHGSA